MKRSRWATAHSQFGLVVVVVDTSNLGQQVMCKLAYS